MLNIYVMTLLHQSAENRTGKLMLINKINQIDINTPKDIKP